MAEKPKQIQEHDITNYVVEYVENYGCDNTLPVNLANYIAEKLGLKDGEQRVISNKIVSDAYERWTDHGKLSYIPMAKEIIANLPRIPDISAKIYTPTDGNSEIFTGPYVKLPNSTVEFTPDNVNHPAHYTSGQFETIDIIKDKLTPEQFEGFCIGNVIKYVTRYKQKNGLEDLEKARWYLNKIIEVKKNADK